MPRTVKEIEEDLRGARGSLTLYKLKVRDAEWLVKSLESELSGASSKSKEKRNG